MTIDVANNDAAQSRRGVFPEFGTEGLDKRSVPWLRGAVPATDEKRAMIRVNQYPNSLSDRRDATDSDGGGHGR